MRLPSRSRSGVLGAEAVTTGRRDEARAYALAALRDILDRGRTLDDVLASNRQPPETRDRAFARNLVATTLRRLGQIDAILASFLERPLPGSAAAARNALRLGVCQILFLDTPAHAAVDTSVALAMRHGPARFARLVNAVLRRAAREAEYLPARHPPELNVPDWLRQSWKSAYGDRTAELIAAAHLVPPPLDVTVKRNPAEWANRLGGDHLYGATVRLPGGDVAALPGYADGAWWVQDLAAALPALLLVAATGAHAQVCDMCAAPGGKTAQLAAAGLDVVAVDVSARRLRILADNLKRLRLTAQLVEADATAWRPSRAFDGVLLDAPCAATGTIRRRPDVPWLKTGRDVARMADLQKKLVRTAVDLAGPGRPILYSVCSLEPEECAEVVDGICRDRADVVRDPVRREELGGLPVDITERGDVRTLPGHLADRGGMDGFFIGRLRKLG